MSGETSSTSSPAARPLGRTAGEASVRVDDPVAVGLCGGLRGVEDDSVDHFQPVDIGVVLQSPAK